jgi:hypothetical protein
MSEKGATKLVDKSCRREINHKRLPLEASKLLIKKRTMFIKLDYTGTRQYHIKIIGQ